MKYILKLLLITLFPIFSFGQAPSHSQWNSLLQACVSPNGQVNYKAFKSRQSELDSYLKTLSGAVPSGNWTKNEKMAYWINAYNAYTIKLILNHYPIKSIMDIEKDGVSPWDQKFIKMHGKSYTLNEIEHTILRKQFSEPRIHFAVNCASQSCPALMNKAYTAKNLSSELEKSTRKFINNSEHNKISSNSVKVSKIFEWFKEDFTKNGTLIDFLAKYADTKIDDNATISYLEYDWSLNGF